MLSPLFPYPCLCRLAGTGLEVWPAKQAQVPRSEDQYDALQLGGMIFPFQPIPVLLTAVTSCTVAVVGTITLLQTMSWVLLVGVNIGVGEEICEGH